MVALASREFCNFCATQMSSKAECEDAGVKPPKKLHPIQKEKQQETNRGCAEIIATSLLNSVQKIQLILVESLEKVRGR